MKRHRRPANLDRAKAILSEVFAATGLTEAVFTAPQGPNGAACRAEVWMLMRRFGEARACIMSWEEIGDCTGYHGNAVARGVAKFLARAERALNPSQVSHTPAVSHGGNCSLSGAQG